MEEDDPARTQVPTIEGTQTGIAVDVTQVEAAGQEEHLEGEKEA